jgi:hypothetical protein
LRNVFREFAGEGVDGAGAGGLVVALVGVVADDLLQ